jgi:hypothetical protein
MNWMLVIIVLGTQPVKTDLVFDTLDKCLAAGDLMRSEQGVSWYGWQAAMRKMGVWEGWWGYWRMGKDESAMRRRLGMENETTCVPQSLK